MRNEQEEMIVFSLYLVTIDTEIGKVDFSRCRFSTNEQAFYIS